MTAATSPIVRLALISAGEGMTRSLEPQADGLCPALLVSYVYYKRFAPLRHLYHFRDWVLDSGAWSAHNAGHVIDFDKYLDLCKGLLSSDPLLTEVFSLDVIGDWRKGLANTERMWKAGVPAIPTFHGGEPDHVLMHLAANYPKIALGGVVRWARTKKLAWIQQCFARVWPKKIHGLGMAAEDLLMAVPFHSTDASSWEFGPKAWGQWKAYGNLSVKGGKQNMRSQVVWYQRLERLAQAKWAKEMATLEAL